MRNLNIVLKSKSYELLIFLFLSLFSVFSDSGIFDADSILEGAKNLKLSKQNPHGSLKYITNTYFDLENHIRSMNNTLDPQMLVSQLYMSGLLPNDSRWKDYKNGIKDKYVKNFQGVEANDNSGKDSMLLKHPEGKIYPLKFSSVAVTETLNEGDFQLIKSKLLEEVNLKFELEQIPIICDSVTIDGCSLDSIEKIKRSKLPVIVDMSPSHAVYAGPAITEKYLPQDIFTPSDPSIDVSFDWPTYTTTTVLSLIFKRALN